MVATLNDDEILLLTDKQREVYEFVIKGNTSSEIAKVLGIKVECAKSRVKRIKRKIKKIKNGEFKGKQEKQLSVAEIKDVEFHKQQASFWKKKHNELLKISSFENQIIKLFDNSIKKFNPIKRIYREASHKTTSNEELVLLLSDFHAGETVRSEEILDMNEYDMNIMEQRINNLYNTIESILLKMDGYNYQKLNIFLLGDIVSGIIHTELLEGVTMVDQVLITAEILSEIIKKWSAHFEEIEVNGVVGNHGRLFKKPNFKAKYNSFDFILYKFIEAKCENLENVKFDFPKSQFQLREIQGWNFLLMHGDGVRGSMGIPLYGLKRMDANISQSLVSNKNKYPEYITMGHFHQSSVMEKVGGKIILNGSLKGTDNFSLGALFVSGEPKQTLFGVHKDHGITWSMDINVS